ncbi:hypothetical protein MXB_762, partial [Myxobolus squamalis]
ENIPHIFVREKYSFQIICDHCRKVIPITSNHVLQCKDCKINVHEKCQHLVPNGCQGFVKEISVDISAQSNELRKGVSDNAKLNKNYDINTLNGEAEIEFRKILDKNLSKRKTYYM